MIEHWPHHPKVKSLKRPKERMVQKEKKGKEKNFK